MSSKEQNEVAVEKIDNDKASADAKCELKGTKRAAEVSDTYEVIIIVGLMFLFICFINMISRFANQCFQCLYLYPNVENKKRGYPGVVQLLPCECALGNEKKLYFKQ